MSDCDLPASLAPLLQEAEFDRISGSLQAIAHPVRLRILELIARHEGELCVCEIQSRFDLTQPTISHHLRVLRDAGLVTSRAQGTWVHHGLAPGAVDGVVSALSRIAHPEGTSAS